MTQKYRGNSRILPKPTNTSLDLQYFSTQIKKCNNNRHFIPLNISKGIADALVVTLYTKFVQEVVIPSIFQQARHILAITTDGRTFLMELLQMVHTMLAMKKYPVYTSLII